MSKSKIPLKDMLQAIDRNDFDFYSRLDKEQKKDFSPWLAMRYASSANGMAAYHYLLMVNDIVNVDFTSLKNHPELQWKLLATCGMGRNTFHPWIPPGKATKKDKRIEFLRQIKPHLSSDELGLWAALNTDDDLKELAAEYGYEDSEIKQLLK